MLVKQSADLDLALEAIEEAVNMVESVNEAVELGLAEEVNARKLANITNALHALRDDVIDYLEECLNAGA